MSGRRVFDSADRSLPREHAVDRADPDDVRELLNYRRAFDLVSEQLEHGGPATEGLIRGIHKRLVEGVRGGAAAPGVYRRVQNLVVNTATRETVYTPPPAFDGPILMAELVTWLNLNAGVQPVIVSGIAQFQFVLPYAKDVAWQWVDSYVKQFADIEAYRNPDPAKMDDAARRRLELWKTVFPKTFTITPSDLPGPFPILMDGDQAVSRGLGLFSLDWGGSKVEQDIPAVFLIDATGRAQFKYLSQNTLDRPPLAYLVQIVSLLSTPR